jgi:hypothetical protein
MTTVRLAELPRAPGSYCLIGAKGIPQVSMNPKPPLLVSYAHIKFFLEDQAKYYYRDWVLDSGAFSVTQSGTIISVEEYTEFAKEKLLKDPTLTEVFALDVIGDHEASLKNAEYMWDNGVPAIPAYHRGSPESALIHIAKNYPKIALGGVALLRGNKKTEWAKQCFARVWPKKIHGFGFGARSNILALPWHSVDATNWVSGGRFGQWNSFGRLSVSAANLAVYREERGLGGGTKHNFRCEVEYFMDLEKEAINKWKKEMAILEALKG